MAGIATPPPAAPVAPSVPPAQSSGQTPPTQPPSGPSPNDMEADPNLAMARLVSKSREKNTSGAPSTPAPAEKPAETPVSSPPAAPPETPKKLTELFGKALKFTQKPPSAAPKAPDPAVPPAAPAAPAAPQVEPVVAKKPAKAKKQQPAVDPTAMATAAASAATEAAVRAMQPRQAPAPTPADNLSDDDRRDFEVAQHLARLDPRYADAPKIILDHVSRAEDYAARWEAANPGKEFDASDDEHDEFFSTLERPWSSSDFNEAKIDLAAEKKLSKFKDEQQGSLRGLHEDQAHMELAPVVDRKFNDVVTTLAKSVGDDIHKAITTGGWDELQKLDPVTAQVLGATLNQMHPFIEAAIEIDDPRQRVRIDVNNKAAHAQWNQVVTTGEARLTGQQLEDGRTFAKRSDYVRMTPAQQAAHWYLTTDMIIQGALDYAADQVKTVADAKKKELESLGFTRKAPVSQAGGASPPTQSTPSPATPEAAPAVQKPVSPTVGTGAKIDDSGGAPKTGEAALMQQISGILFRK